MTIINNFILNLNSINSQNYFFIFKTKLYNNLKEPYNLKTGIQENSYLNSKELSMFKTKTYEFDSPITNTSNFFSKFKGYTLTNTLLIKKPYFKKFLLNDKLNDYWYNKFNLALTNKNKKIIIKKGIVIGISNFNYIIYVDGFICNMPKKKTVLKIYDSVFVNILKIKVQNNNFLKKKI